MLYFLDTESTGLMGAVNLIQIGFYDKENKLRIAFLRPPIEPEKSKEIITSIMYDSDNTVVIYNAAHDLFKLYQQFNFDKPFLATTIDLMLRVKTDLLINNSKCIYLTGIHKEVLKRIADKVCADIKEKIKLPIKASFHQNKKNPLLIDISFHIKFTAKLKDIIVLLGLDEEATKIEETDWRFPDKEEKEYIVRFPEDEEYKKMFEDNEKILNSSGSSFWYYAIKDIKYLELLYKYFQEPKQTTNDVMAEIVAYTRWHGFEIDKEELKKYLSELKNRLSAIEQEFSFNLASSKQRLEWLRSQGIKIKDTSKKSLASLLEEMKISGKIEIADKIKSMLEYGAIRQRINQAEKLLEAGRAHPNFRVIGAESGRMAGTSGLNFQGIDRSPLGIRRCIKISQGGDFDALELNIAAYAMNDPVMQDDLKHRDMHLQTALCLLDIDYETAKKRLSAGDKEIKRIRQIGKVINFSILYFCSQNRVEDLLAENGGDPSKGAEILEQFKNRYKKIAEAAKEMERSFVTLTPNRFYEAENAVAEMKEDVCSLFGTKRKFIFEKIFCQYLISTKLESLVPEDLRKEIITRQKKKGEQTVDRSIISSRFGAVMEIQQSVYRMGGNHIIQSTGADLTKKLMEALWKKFRIPMMNIHDEIIVPSGYEHSFLEINEVVQKKIEEFRKVIPSLLMEWKKLNFWSEK